MNILSSRFCLEKMYVSCMFDLSVGCNVSNKIIRKSMKQKKTLQGRSCMTFVEAASLQLLRRTFAGQQQLAQQQMSPTRQCLDDQVSIWWTDGKVGMCLTDLS